MTVVAEIRRCRPLLGTLVEMRLFGGSERLRHRAADHAFDAVAQVHQRMSFHLPDSDVSRLNAWAHLRPVRVCPWTWTVLREALEISEATDGLFDVTVGDRLVGWGFLPRANRRGPRLRQRVSWKDIRLLPDSRVRFARPLSVDLGGIAKGFAVDCAVSALHEAGVEGGVVNAGGDLRAFGEQHLPVSVRDPEAPGVLLNLTRVHDEALATSGSYFSGSRSGTRRLSPLVDPRRRAACVRRWSCSVKAPRCLVADALTKVLLILGESAGPILDGFSASGYIVRGRGRVLSSEPASGSLQAG